MEFIEDGSNQLSPRNRSNGLAALAIQPPATLDMSRQFLAAV